MIPVPTGKKPETIKCRLLPAQSLFITESFATRLGLKVHRKDVSVTGVGNTNSVSKDYVDLAVQVSPGQVLRTQAVLLHKLIKDLPSQPMDTTG